ncbi:hypothetical protein LI063_05765 [Clostridium perfringens]|uniref:hypothetical protein n=1 Tax=Clostridium perfringens TaxID=1502 RepID=UPI00224600BA|nr:hypothetical protein [Clostridium perfringens]MCX0363665.1 hypothetical protein [Clostridium perfringens]
MNKYEKALDEVLERQYYACENMEECTNCCIFEECVIAYVDNWNTNKKPTKEEFVKKIKEELLLYVEE